jgi:hypothetical protein
MVSRGLSHYILCTGELPMAALMLAILAPHTRLHWCAPIPSKANAPKQALDIQFAVSYGLTHRYSIMRPHMYSTYKQG